MIYRILWVCLLAHCGFFGFVTPSVKAQSSGLKVMDHVDLVSWNQIRNPIISANGRWITYELKPELGDGILNIWNAETGRTLSFDRASGSRISADSELIAFIVTASRDTLRAMERRKVKRADMPPDTLVLFFTQNEEVVIVPGVHRFDMPEYWAGVVAWYPSATGNNGDTIPASADTISASGASPQSDIKKEKEQNDENGHHLVIFNYTDSTATEIPFVKSLVFSRDAARGLIHTTGDEMETEAGMYLAGLKTATLRLIHSGGRDYYRPVICDRGESAAFMVRKDTGDAKVPELELYWWDLRSDTAIMLNTNDFLSQFEEYRLSEHGSLEFARSGKHLYLGIAPMPALPPEDALPDEMVQVEVWHYLDPVLYTQQHVRRNDELKRTFRAVYHSDRDVFVRLSDEEKPGFATSAEGDGSWALLYNDESYIREASWDGYPSRRDVSIVNIITGERVAVAEGVAGNVRWSPAGKYLYWYSKPDSAWKAWSVSGRETIRLTSNDEVMFFNELHDVPDFPGSYGLAGWTGNDTHVIIYDRYDMWKIDPTSPKHAVNLTGKRDSLWVCRYIDTDPDTHFIPLGENWLIHVTSKETMSSGYAQLNPNERTMTALKFGAMAYSRRPQKARDSDRLFFTAESFERFPDLMYTDLGFQTVRQVSDANPQQSEYQWGSISLFTWTGADGRPVRGLLVKPADFDPSVQYPLIVNFYERSSHTLHHHRIPFPHRSTVNYSFYASRGYVIFNPDISYTVGYPGESAYNAVVTGTTALINEGFIDPERIGIQGHSWGGYQIAHIITRTGMFRCAASGAPVVNMLSAYGGIRWETGLSRMFQYERTQSRIGGSIWEYPLRYIENSPLFFMDKVTTPVLIMHNDRDGHVPWYQGIEFFIALRRLEKPAWLLNYNNEPHWPLKLENRIDFNIRLQQFFDHYLMGEPMPRWMEEGVPAILKGIETGY